LTSCGSTDQPLAAGCRRGSLEGCGGPLAQDRSMSVTSVAAGRCSVSGPLFSPGGMELSCKSESSCLGIAKLQPSLQVGAAKATVLVLLVSVTFGYYSMRLPWRGRVQVRFPIPSDSSSPADTEADKRPSYRSPGNPDTGKQDHHGDELPEANVLERLRRKEKGAPGQGASRDGTDHSANCSKPISRPTIRGHSASVLSRTGERTGAVRARHCSPPIW
jgi:hypothetical protein